MGVYYIGSIPCSGGDIYHYGRKGMKWGKNIFGKISEFFTGNNARRELASATSQRNGVRQQARALQGTSVGSAASAKQGWSHTSNFGPINGKNYKVIYGTGDEQRRAVAQENYNRTLPGMTENARKRAQEIMSKAREQVSGAYSKAAEALGNKGLDIQSFYSQVMQKAQGAINAGKNMVSKYGGQFVSQIQNLGSKALEGGKAFLDNAMERARNAGENVREFVTGNRSRAELESAKTALKGAKQKSRHFDGKDPDGSYSYKIKKDRDHPVDIGGTTFYPFVETGNRHSTEVSRQNERLRKAQAEYDKTLPGQIEKIKKKRKK